MDLAELVKQYHPHAVELRHSLHQAPQLAYQETLAAELIRRELARLQIPFVPGPSSAPTATLAFLGLQDDLQGAIAFRADIDALPIAEMTGAAYASRHPGTMHACGHDGHTASLLGAAAILKQIEGQLPRRITLIFQPAEEGGGGAARLIEAGALDGRLGPKVAAIFGLHGWPGLPLGVISSRPGPLMAATDGFAVTVRGVGGHGAFPHLGHDPLTTACSMVGNLQQIVSRDLDPVEPAIVTVGQIHAGTAINIIPDEAHFCGTLRTLNDSTRRRAMEALNRRCRGIAQAGGCEASVSWSEGYPALVNDPRMTEHVATIARAALGPTGYLPAGAPCMGAEDFSHYLLKIPGCFFFLGLQAADQPPLASLHHCGFDFPDQALAVAMRIWSELALSPPPRL